VFVRPATSSRTGPVLVERLIVLALIAGTARHAKIGGSVVSAFYERNHVVKRDVARCRDATAEVAGATVAFDDGKAVNLLDDGRTFDAGTTAGCRLGELVHVSSAVGFERLAVLLGIGCAPCLTLGEDLASVSLVARPLLSTKALSMGHIVGVRSCKALGAFSDVPRLSPISNATSVTFLISTLGRLGYLRIASVFLPIPRTGVLEIGEAGGFLSHARTRTAIRLSPHPSDSACVERLEGEVAVALEAALRLGWYFSRQG
jgi:hypothetical protein